jgi:LysM repeat protein
MNKLIILFCCLFMAANDKTQKMDLFPITQQLMSKVDTTTMDSFAADRLYNATVLERVFLKLKENEKHNFQKINIVHIGDSHIQGDMMTNQIRKNLQQRFGNAGRGFVFPYALAQTNGSFNERFQSNRAWQSYRNIHPVKNVPVGLSGIGLWRDRGDFVMELSIKEAAYKFNSIRIITPGNQPMFDLALSSQTKIIQTTQRRVITHKIKKGEVISTIADKYKVSVADIKRDNGLKSTNIRAGRTLKIQTNETRPKSVSSSEFVPVALQSDSFSHYYNSEKELDKIYLIPNKTASQYELSGLVLEKDMPGVVYSSIGVNGAKFSDYNKYPLFFEQLKALQPDLLVFSLGTNESYDHMDVAAYLNELRVFMNHIKTQHINVPILVMTPPPSLLKGKKPNVYVQDYAKGIIEISKSADFAVWDLYQEFGGLDGIQNLKATGLIGPDWVHYSKKGYEKQGDLFSQAFLKAYDNFKLKK